MPGLENYLTLLARVDEMCGRTAEAFAAAIACRPGCDACCRHLSVSAVEAAALNEAVAELPQPEVELIRDKAQGSAPDAPCPLLHEGLCLLYRARPLICRTHGLPLLITGENGRAVDFCPENFQGVTSIPGSAVIDLDRLNALLAAINTLYLQEFPGPERVVMADALIIAASKRQDQQDQDQQD